MRDDVKYAVKGFARAKTSAAVLLFSLAVGTGANVTLYSVLDALLFRAPEGVQDPARLTLVFTSQFNEAAYGYSSYPDYQSLAGESTTFESIAAFNDSGFERVALRNWLQRVRITEVSDEFFPTLQAAAHTGRLLEKGDAAAESPAAVISYRLWTALGKPGDVIGTLVRVGEREYTIAGIAPARFEGLQLARASEVWIPLTASQHSSRGDRRLSIVGRLKRAADLPDAQDELTRTSHLLAERYPETNRGTRSSAEAPRLLTVAPYSRIDPSARQQVVLIGFVVMGATGMLLLSACVNAGSLLLSRSAARRRELAVKLALGASRRLLVRQVVVESLMLSLAGAGVGLLLAYWTSGVLPSLFAPEEAEMLDTSLDAPLVAASIALACLAGAIFAIGPARHATDTADVEVLRADAGGISDRTAGGRLRTVVVVGQVALSTVLLIASGLLIQALRVALEGDLGPGGRGLAIALLRMPGDLRGEAAKGISYQAKAIEAVRKLPGARAAGWVATLPVGRAPTQVFHVEVAPTITETVEVDVNIASAGYFSAMRIPVIEGRNFGTEDGALARPVVIVNDLFARRHFSPTAVGRRLRDFDGTTFEIVGVVRSGKYRTLQEPPEPMVYFPLSQRHLGQLHLIMRTDQAADPMLGPMRATLESVDDRVTVIEMMTFEGHLAQALSLDRLATTIVVACALAALLLATVGVYGVIADAVRRRTAEIGLRIALGANRRQVLRLVFSEGLHLAVAGVVVGVAAAMLLRRAAGVFVHGLPAVDLVSLVVVPGVLALVVVSAAAIPTRRALRISPTIALRAE